MSFDPKRERGPTPHSLEQVLVCWSLAFGCQHDLTRLLQLSNLVKGDLKIFWSVVDDFFPPTFSTFMGLMDETPRIPFTPCMDMCCGILWLLFILC
jgi:hypothetical protein